MYHNPTSNLICEKYHAMYMLYIVLDLDFSPKDNASRQRTREREQGFCKCVRKFALLVIQKLKRTDSIIRSCPYLFFN